MRKKLPKKPRLPKVVSVGGIPVEERNKTNKKLIDLEAKIDKLQQDANEERIKNKKESEVNTLERIRQVLKLASSDSASQEKAFSEIKDIIGLA